MKAKILIIILLISLLPLPSTTAQVPTASVSIDCSDDGLNVTSLFSANYPVEEDPRQPNDENKTLYMFWNASNSNAWSHFQMVDDLTDEVYSEEVENGLIDIDLRFEMEPTLAQRLHMTPSGLFKGSFNIYVEGDWTNDNDGNTACGQNDCEELNITLMAGPNVIGRHHETGLVTGNNQVAFNFPIEEDTIIDWDGDQFNPEVRVTMTLRGNYQAGSFIFAPTGEPAKFEMSMGEQSYIELPISPSQNRSIIYSPEIADVRCTVSNPTPYIEKVELSTSTNYPVSLLSTDEMYVGANSEEEFSIFVSVDENFLGNYYLTDEYWFYTNASVVEISGLPPANTATASNTVTQVEEENQQTCSDCFILHHVLAGSRIGMKAPTYSGDLYEGETWRSFNSEGGFDSSSTAPFTTAWTALQFIDLNCPYCRAAASEEMVDWVDRFDPSNSSQGSPNVEITTIVSHVVDIQHTEYTFTVVDAAGPPTATGGEDLVYVAMDAGDDLSWATVIVQLSDGGSYTECTNPDQAADTGCAVSDNGDGKWAFGEEVTISEGSDDICASACTVQVRILHRETNEVIFESSQHTVAFESTTFSVNKSGILEFRSLYNHTHDYLDDMDNDNSDSWEVNGLPHYALIQPNGFIAWDTASYHDVGWSEELQKPVFLDDCLDLCQLDDAILNLVDVFDILDTDGDGVPDADDVFPYDSNETMDSDGDGVGDNSDAFPDDPNETHDDDSDGIGNNTDAFPQDENETHDDDGDGVGNNSDAFPQDANETMDSDGDGVGDNADPEPDNPDVRTPQDISVEISDTSSYILAGAIVFLAFVIIFVRRKAPPQVIDSSAYVSQDSMWNDEN
ncbi:MAG: hypothetical protein ACO3NY_04965 [Poseidonia sp.]